MTLNYRDGSMVDFYCPACGTDSPLDHPISYLGPDLEYDITCPKCRTEFTIKVTYIPKEETNGEDDQRTTGKLSYL